MKYVKRSTQNGLTGVAREIVTAGDFDDMKQFGAYIFYRVGITPAGQWTFFVAGD